jgi:hypothetical protein
MHNEVRISDTNIARIVMINNTDTVMDLAFTCADAGVQNINL